MFTRYVSHFSPGEQIFPPPAVAHRNQTLSNGGCDLLGSRSYHSLTAQNEISRGSIVVKGLAVRAVCLCILEVADGATSIERSCSFRSGYCQTGSSHMAELW